MKNNSEWKMVFRVYFEEYFILYLYKLKTNHI